MNNWDFQKLNYNSGFGKIFLFIKNQFWFFLSFAVSKGLVFLTPLLFAEILSIESFGVLEYALSGLGFVLNTLLNLGVPGSYPYFILKKKKINIRNGFSIHPLWLLLVFIVNTILYLFEAFDEQIFLAMNIAFVISNQIFYSIQLKSHEKSALAVVLDSGVYLVLFISYIIFKLKIVTISIPAINCIIFMYGVYYAFLGIKNFSKALKKNILAHYKLILRYSKNLLIASFLIFLITSSGRIVVEWFFGFDKVGIYGFYYRLAAIVVMIHQIINITYFKKIYTVKPQILDNYFARFFAFIYGFSIVFYYSSPIVMNSLSTFFRETYLDNSAVFFILSSQMVVWIASALNSNIIDRENLMKPNNIRFMILVVVFMSILFLLKASMTFELVAYTLYSSIFIACIIQYYSLYKKDIFFYKSAVVLFISFTITSLMFFSR